MRKCYMISTCLFISLFITLCFSACSESDGETFDMALSGEEEPLESKADAQADAVKEPAAEEKKCIYVFLCGAVQRPGVYELPEGSRLFELLERAGGMTEDAAVYALNQAEVLSDGIQIRVPSIGEADDPAIAGNSAAAALASNPQDGRININTASLSDLMTINGIGEARAQAIIDYREEHGAFATIEDIKSVSGIKDGLFNKIKDHITV